MICQKCEHCKKISEDKGVYSITCGIQGAVTVHSDYKDRFNCNDYMDRVTPKEPPKPNIIVILKTSGRDISVYSEMVKSGKAICDWWEMVDRTKPVTIGNFVFNPEDISVIGYIG